MSQPKETEGLDPRELLRSLRVDLPAGDFQAQLHRRLVAIGVPEAPSFWQRLGAWVNSDYLWPLSGLAAGTCVFLVLSQIHSSSALRQGAAHQIAAAERPATEVPATKVAVVRLDLTADVAVEHADIRISLPEGLVFWSEGRALASRAFEWSQSLARGDNFIPVAVKGERPGRYKMTLSARIGHEHVEHEVLLEVTSG